MVANPFDIYEARIVWDGRIRRISVDEANTDPLIGMQLLDGYELTIQVVSGGNVVVRAM